MSFLDKIKQQAGVAAQAAGTVAQTAVQQTKTLAAVGRVKLAIASEEDKMKKAYTELGKLFYRDYEAQTEAEMTDYEPWCGRVADAKAQIARLTEELEKLRAEEPQAETAAPEPAIELDLTVATEDVPETETPVEETPAAEEAPAVEEPAEAAPEAEIPDVTAAPTVDTLYVDVSGTEE